MRESASKQYQTDLSEKMLVSVIYRILIGKLIFQFLIRLYSFLYRLSKPSVLPVDIVLWTLLVVRNQQQL